MRLTLHNSILMQAKDLSTILHREFTYERLVMGYITISWDVVKSLIRGMIITS